jgi:hypothetical protein
LVVSGISTSSAPVETKTLTTVAGGAIVPDGGSVRMTSSLATVGLDSSAIVAARSSSSRASWAAS